MQWYYDETDEDHAAATTFNINGAEYVKEQIAYVDLPPLGDDIRAEQAFISDRACGSVSSDGWHCERPANHPGFHAAPGYRSPWDESDTCDLDDPPSIPGSGF